MSLFKCLLSFQDKKDDIMIGVKSTALLFEEKTTRWLNLFSVPMVTMLVTSGYFSDQTLPYYLATGGVAAHLVWQVNLEYFTSKVYFSLHVYHFPSWILLFIIYWLPIYICYQKSANKYSLRLTYVFLIISTSTN